MKTQAAFLIWAMVLQAVATMEACKSVFFDGKPYVEELMKDEVYKPSSLAVDDNTKTLYCSFLRLFTLEFKTIKLDLNTKQFEKVDIDMGFAIAVDQKRHITYIGGAGKGIYKYDSLANKATLILYADLWKLHFSEALYYIEIFSHNVYKYVDGKSTLFEDLAGIEIYHFAKDGDFMVYSNGTGVYGKKEGAGESVLLKPLKSVDDIRDIALDRKGRFFVLTADGIHKVERVKQFLEKVADIQQAHAITFDDDNQLIYSKEWSVVRLVSYDNCEM